MLYVLVLSILVFSLLGVEGWLYMLASRVIVIPLVAGIAFEFIMWSARHQDSALVRVLVWPGLQMQKLTTREPSDDRSRSDGLPEEGSPWRRNPRSSRTRLRTNGD